MIDLYILNLFAWFFLAIFIDGDRRAYSLLLALIFSSSYWLYFPVSDFLNKEYSPSVLANYIDEALLYSAVAGVAFNSALIITMPSKKYYPGGDKIRDIFDKLFCRLPGQAFLLPLKFFAATLILIAFSNVLPFIESFSRLSWLESSDGASHLLLTTILAIILFYVIILDYGKSRKISVTTFLLVVLHIILVGFDGSRRASFIAILGYLVVWLNLFLVGGGVASRKKWLISIFIFLSLLTTYFSIGRSFSVGWAAVLSPFSLPDYAIKSFLLSIVVPNPTVHVNTHMVEYVNDHGFQGMGSYFQAVLNTIFPRFIFGDYFFGKPLVLRLHEELGWFGFDFGFLAEAIYSGGFFSVILMHAILGFVAGFIMRGVKKGEWVYCALLVGLIFALLNCLRSDFMNFLKAFVYMSVFMMFVFYFGRRFHWRRY